MNRNLKVSGILAATALMLAACGDNKAPTTTTPNQPQQAEAGNEQKNVMVKEARTNEELYNLALSFNGFIAGGESKGMMANPEVIVFFDPQCPHCGTYWNATRILKDVKMKWIPVGILNEKSKQVATHILASANPVETMNLNENLLSDRQGGLDVNNSVAEYEDKVTENTDFFAVNMRGVPFSIYRNSSGEYGTFAGAVDVAELMEALKIASVELDTVDSTSQANAQTPEPVVESSTSGTESSNVSETATQAQSTSSDSGTETAKVEEATASNSDNSENTGTVSITEEVKTAIEAEAPKTEEAKTDTDGK